MQDHNNLNLSLSKLNNLTKLTKLTKDGLNVSKSKVQQVIATEDHRNQRIDNFLYGFFNKKIPRSLIYSLIRTGQVRVNSARLKPGYNLCVNDKIRIPPVKFDVSLEKNHLATSTAKKSLHKNNKHLRFWQEKIKNGIIFENNYLLVINKPAKLAVHGGSKINIGLLEVLRSLRPEERFLELVHRLDRDTSGCIMIAKKRSYLKKLHLLLQERKVTKVYLALVKGIFNEKQTIELPLKKIIRNSKEHFVQSSESGSYAKTICLPEKCFINKNASFNSSLIIAKPLTGRTHQIRVHLTSIGFPIANDDKYGDKGYNDSMKKLGLKRMFLHAQKLEFICPETNQVIVANAELDNDIANVLSKLI